MLTFREFLEYTYSRDDIKSMVLDALEADPQSDTVENAPLADYERRKSILSYPSLDPIIRNHPNRGAIIRLVQDGEHDTNITVGMLINVLSSNR